MKRLVTTFVIVLFLSTIAFAQIKNTNEFAAHIGYTASDISNSRELGSGYKYGFTAGVSLDHYFSDRWSIKGQVIYDQKGWDSQVLISDEYLGTVIGVSTGFRLNYITMPVLANWHFGRTRNWYLQFGPYAGFLLNAKREPDNADIKSLFNTTDAGLDLGIGVKIPVSDKLKIFIELNGQGGAIDIAKNSGSSTSLNTSSSLNVGIAF